MKKLFLLAAALTALTAAVTACNTVEGVGKDVKAGGNKLEDSASDNKRY